MTHPLTDEICREVADSMTHFPNGFPEPEDHMRAGADWQLEADAEWWRIILNKAEFLPPHAVNYIVEEFKQSMRPQEDN